MLGSAFQFLDRVIALNRLEKGTASAATAQVSRKAASTVSGSGSPKKIKITRWTMEILEPCRHQHGAFEDEALAMSADT